MTNSQAHFSLLQLQLRERLARAIVSQMGPQSAALRQHLLESLASEPGSPAGLLAPPVFEGLFDWASSEQRLRDVPFLNPDLADRLNQPTQLGEETFDPLFPDSHQVHRHQFEAWDALINQPNKSVLVRTGTASGKTEAFLVPILNDLTNEIRAGGGPPLVGVRALFLYPLNALINSQRDRLVAGTAPFGSQLRFALYNGNTPERLAGRLAINGPEIRDRTRLRETPPPMLVTNATMLEYMLVRQRDAPIIESSRGLLRWIVLDEAHTYIGSAAAEIALLLRRVLHTFDVTPENVRFVATSATIGGDDQESEERLATFLSDLAGVDRSQVVVVSGRRLAPELPARLTQVDAPLPVLDGLSAMSDDEAGETLATNAGVRQLRESMCASALNLEQVASVLGTNTQEAVGLLDELSRAEVDGLPLLPVRAHHFLRTQPGLWVCTNPTCAGLQATPLDDADWPFGKLFFERRVECDSCSAQVTELVLCKSCGEQYAVVRMSQDGGWLPARWVDREDQDAAPDADDILDPDEEEDEPVGQLELLCGVNGARDSDGEVPQPVRFDPTSGQQTAQGESVHRISRTARGALRCGRCGSSSRVNAPVARAARLGIPFILRATLPTVAEHTPTMPGGAALRPSQGRRLITFTDSRQGTARHFVGGQLESERLWTRAWTYHHLWSEVRRQGQLAEGGHEEIAVLRSQLEELERLPDNPNLASLKTRLEREIAELEGRGQVAGGIRWLDVRAQMARQPTVEDWMRRDQKRRYKPARLEPIQLAEICLVRELFRRPKRFPSLETLGLVRLDYPQLGSEPPRTWTALGATNEQWREFLSFLVDFFVRSHSAVDIDRELVRWIGLPINPTWIGSQDAVPERNRLYAWPSAERNPNSRPVRLLRTALTNRCGREPTPAELDHILHAAWLQVTASPYMVPGEAGFRLAMQDVDLAPVERGFLCPITGRILGHTVLGYSPYGVPRDPAEARPIVMPEPVFQFPEPADSPRVEAWLAQDERVREGRALGYWTEFSDRIARFGPVLYLSQAEHSAQVPRGDLEQAEKEFKQGRINVLHCSTTMEMGVDIGGLSAVVMNNAPPAPANYLQRAGRAGRRDSRRSVVVTLCPARPHGQAVFANPMWPFETPVRAPEVALQSERIVRRQVNSLLLGEFFQTHRIADGLRLQAGAFFVPPNPEENSPSDFMQAWLHDEAPYSERVLAGVQRLCRNSALEGREASLFRDSAFDLERVTEKWGAERTALRYELDRVGGDLARPMNEAPALEVRIRIDLRRLEEEFLLRVLAERGFLPSYGFPLHVVSFVTTNIEEIEEAQRRRRRGDDAGPEDRPQQRNGYPSRGLEMALREYTPGNRVVINGMVREPKGVTLNWIAPAGDTQAREPQSLATYWRCRNCGDTGSQRRRVENCPACGSRDVRAFDYLEPAGFAVDVRDRPHSDVSQRHFEAAPPPVVSASGVAWRPLPAPAVGRYRTSNDGRVFAYVAGPAHRGFVICQHCGRTDALPDHGGLPTAYTRHRPLRGGIRNQNLDARDERCPGANGEHSWAGRYLGGERQTDVFDLDLIDPATNSALGGDRAQSVARTLAIALREALARQLGIDVRELGCSARSIYRPEQRWIVSIYDEADGGAGYSPRAADDLPALFEGAREVLQCPRDCDRGCHACVLTYDTQQWEDEIDRRATLEALTEEFVQRLHLAEDYQAFGPTTRFEQLSLLQAVRRSAQRHGVQRALVYVGGDVTEWDWKSWPAVDALRALRQTGAQVEIVLTETALSELESDEARELAAHVMAHGWALKAVPEHPPVQGAMSPILELEAAQRSTCWAISEFAATEPNEWWAEAQPEQEAVTPVIVRSVGPFDRTSFPVGRIVDPASLMPEPDASSFAYTWRMPRLASMSRFGPALLEAVEQNSGGLISGRSGSALLAVRYDDRYLRSPLTARLFQSVMVALEKWGRNDSTVIRVRTTHDPRAHRYGDDVGTNFAGPGTQRDTLRLLLDGLGHPAEVEVHDRVKNVPHARRLELVWENGHAVAIVLEQGLGFVQTQRRLPFDAVRSPQDLVADLLRLDVPVTAQNETHLSGHKIA